MAVEITPLGFRKPNGKELVRNMDNEISHNAQKAQDYLGQLLPDVDALKVLGGMAPGDVSDATMTTLANDPNSNFRGALSATYAQLPGGVENALTGWFHIDGYGATGGADDTAAVQAAINAAAAVSGGGVVYIPSGTWNVSGLTIPANTRIHGTGHASVLKLQSGANTDLITIPESVILYMRSVRLDGNKAGNTSGSCVRAVPKTGGTYMGGADLRDVSIVNAPHYNVDVGLDRNNGRILGCFLGRAGVANLRIRGADWIVEQCDIGDSPTNIILDAAAATITSNYIYRGTNYNIDVTANCHYAWIALNSIDSGSQVGLRLSALGSATPRQHTVIGNQFFDNSKAATGTYSAIVCEQVNGPTIVGNSFFHYAGNAVPKYLVEMVTAPSNVTFDANTFDATDYAVSVTNDTSKMIGHSRSFFRSTATAPEFTGTLKAPRFRGASPNSGQSFIDQYIPGEGFPRFQAVGSGRMEWGGGAGAVDVTLGRGAPDRLDLGAGDSLRVDGTWNGGNLRLGANHLWVDATGDLRIKSSAPTSDTDGMVVGTQS